MVLGFVSSVFASVVAHYVVRLIERHRKRRSGDAQPRDDGAKRDGTPS